MEQQGELMSGETPDGESLRNVHKMFLEALRHREQEIIRFLAILGPALGGFVWLLGDIKEHPERFVGGTYGVLAVLLMGGLYALALGYNYRYLTLQLAKIEANKKIDLSGVMLKKWPRKPEDFVRGSRIGVIPWCTPPGIIKVFWLAFVACILGVTLVASMIDVSGTMSDKGANNFLRVRFHDLHDAIVYAGGATFALALLWPVQVGMKLLKAARQEDHDEWTAGGQGQQARGRTMSDKMTDREQRVELFKTLATFGFASAALFCIGGLILLIWDPGAGEYFRKTVALLGGIAGFAIVVCAVLLLPTDPLLIAHVYNQIQGS